MNTTILYNKNFDIHSIQFYSLLNSSTVFLSLKIVEIALASLIAFTGIFYILSVKMELGRWRFKEQAPSLTHSSLSTLFQNTLHPISGNGNQLNDSSLVVIQELLNQNSQSRQVYFNSVPVSTALLRQLIKKEIPLGEKDLISHYTLQNIEGEKYQLNGFEVALLMQYSDFFFDFFKEKNEQKICFSESFEEFESLKILLKSLYEPKILEENQGKSCSLATTSFKFHLNEEKINELLEKLLVASFEKKDSHNIETLLKFFKLYQKPLTPAIQQALQLWLNTSIGNRDFLSKINLLKHYSPHTLDFSSTSINNQELAYVSQLPLTTLILKECEITDQSLQSLKDLLHLEELNLIGCKKITDQGLVHLKRFHDLKKLNLKECLALTNQGLEHLKDFVNLKELDLSWCYQITDQGLEHLKDLTQLQELNLSDYRKITDQGLEHLKDLTQLQKLNLGECEQVKGSGLWHLEHLTHMKELNLSNCYKIYEGLESLKNFTQLQKLNLSGCYQITNRGLKYLRNFTDLQELNLSACFQIKDQELEHLKCLTQLQKLNLNKCDQITNRGLEHLKDLIHLQELNLSGCKQITDHALTYLHQLPKLKELILRGCSQFSLNAIRFFTSNKVVVSY